MSIYTELKKQVERLDVSEKEVVESYILKPLSITIPSNYETENLLKKRDIREQSIRIITVMELSDNSNDFESLIEKRNRLNRLELNDFDKALKAFYSVKIKKK